MSNMWPENQYHQLGNVPDSAYLDGNWGWVYKRDELTWVGGNEPGLGPMWKSDAEYADYLKSIKLEPYVLGPAKLCLAVYRSIYLPRAEKNYNRDTIRIKGPVSLRSFGNGDRPSRRDYFKSLTPRERRVNREYNRWRAGFCTTGLSGADDHRLWRSDMYFDIETDLYQKELSGPSGREDQHVIIGRQNGGPLSQIGVYAVLSELAGGEVARHVEEGGWTDVGDIWFGDMHRYAGRAGESTI